MYNVGYIPTYTAVIQIRRQYPCIHIIYVSVSLLKKNDEGVVGRGAHSEFSPRGKWGRTWGPFVVGPFQSVPNHFVIFLCRVCFPVLR